MFSNSSYTIVTPTFEKHYSRFCDLAKSIDLYCLDKEKLHIIIVIEEKNIPLFYSFIKTLPKLNISILTTESILEYFGIQLSPAEFLKTAGKFTFQSLKKFGGLLNVKTKWSIVLDSETVFVKDFLISEVVQNYEENPYIFYTRTMSRGPEWSNSLVENVTKQCSKLLGFDGSSRNYMELILWFYETEKVTSLLKYMGNKFLKFIRTARPSKPIFENILYYMYMEHIDKNNYKFIDIESEWKDVVPKEISERYRLDKPPLSFLGADHLSYTLRPSDIKSLGNFFAKYKIPFFRLEPFLINSEQYAEFKAIPSLVAFVSSAHIPWVRKRIAICISGEFRNLPATFPKIRHLVGFFMGCDCDIYIHTWHHPDEAIIIESLKPKDYLFEEDKTYFFSDLEQKIFYKEPNLKPGRDEGSIAMLYGMQKSFELAEKSGVDYDFVVRLRPDIYFEPNLSEILRSISMEGELSKDTLYVARHFHSQGINDQFAVGGIDAMRAYMNVFSYMRENISTLYFNPETVVLSNLLSKEVQIVPFDCRYALMRDENYHVENVARIFAEQDRVWWSSCTLFPVYELANPFFEDKLKCVNFLNKREQRISDIFVTLPVFPDASINSVLSISWRDSNPSGELSILVAGMEDQSVVVYPVPQFITLKNGSVVPSPHIPRYVFCYIEDDEFVISEWKTENGKFKRYTIRVEKHLISACSE
ncbi:hypothetical protein MSKU3_1999 [Komagataeibacter oboediens]|nr:hypothetical protein MSKU3_1999 [Komagataeibacter oboediens]